MSEQISALLDAPAETLHRPQAQAYAGTIDEPRPFEIEELFFSTTDKKSHIKTANTVFFRVAAYDAVHLLEKPHNVIRHPDMPRAIFHLMWEEIQAGNPLFAYVKNRAADGRFYWVVALVTPTAEGYLSVRFKPSSDLFPVVQNLYRELRQIEFLAENSGESKPAAIAKSRAALAAKLLTLGYPDYRAFMNDAFEREIRSRDTVLRQRTANRRAPAATSSSNAAATAALGLAHACQAALEALDHLFHELEIYSLNDEIHTKSNHVSTLSGSIRLLSMNGAIEIEQLGGKASGLGKVMDWLQSFSNETTLSCDQLTQELSRLIADIRAVVFALSAAKLQIEMTTDFAHQIARDAAHDAVQDDASPTGYHTSMQQLHLSSSETVGHALTSLAELEGKLHALASSQEALRKSIRSLRLIYLKGKMEMATLASERLVIIFETMHKYLSDTEDNLTSLENLIQELEKELLRGIELSAPITHAVARIDPDALTA